MTFPFKPKSCISLTTEFQLKLLLHVLNQILGDIYRGVQRTPSVTYQKIHKRRSCHVVAPQDHILSPHKA